MQTAKTPTSNQPIERETWPSISGEPPHPRQSTEQSPRERELAKRLAAAEDRIVTLTKALREAQRQLSSSRQASASGSSEVEVAVGWEEIGGRDLEQWVAASDMAETVELEPASWRPLSPPIPAPPPLPQIELPVPSSLDAPPTTIEPPDTETLSWAPDDALPSVAESLDGATGFPLPTLMKLPEED